MIPTSEDEAAAFASAPSRLMADVAGGRIGQHHNSFRHRDRLLGQRAAQARIRGH